MVELAERIAVQHEPQSEETLPAPLYTFSKKKGIYGGDPGCAVYQQRFDEKGRKYEHITTYVLPLSVESKKKVAQIFAYYPEEYIIFLHSARAYARSVGY